MEQMNISKKYSGPTLCWDCAKAIGECSWSQSLTPVDGWDAKYVPDKDSYHVANCPLFERDAYDGGSKRLNPQIRKQEA